MFSGGELHAGGKPTPVTQAQIDCGESGSTLRFLIPIAAALGISATFTGRGKLPERPLKVYLDLLPQHGVSCQSQGGLPLTIAGRLTPGAYALPGNVSSQFITGLLFALPLLAGDSTLTLTSPLESAGYVELTLSILKEYGIKTERIENGWRIPGGQTYRPRDYTVEGDWSQAAFFLAGAALNGELALWGLNRDSQQGDRAIADLLEQFGARLFWKDRALYAQRSELHGIEIDAAQIPDLVPILAVTAAFATGHTRIFHAERLRLKESDRLAAMQQGLSRLGAKVQITPDGLVICGSPTLSGGKICGYNDHRIVMSFAIAALRTCQSITVSDAESVRKSYPNFWEDYRKLGGNANVLNLG